MKMRSNNRHEAFDFCSCSDFAIYISPPPATILPNCAIAFASPRSPQHQAEYVRRHGDLFRQINLELSALDEQFFTITAEQFHRLWMSQAGEAFKEGHFKDFLPDYHRMDVLIVVTRGIAR